MTETPRERLLFVTGRLAESSVRQVIEKIAADQEFEFEIAVLPISVAALLHVDWIKRKLVIESTFDRVILPGWCQGNLDDLASHFGMKFELGPKNIFDLPHRWNRSSSPPDLSDYDVEILAEINHAPRMTREALVELAAHYAESGADVVDLGCIPGYDWPEIADAVKALRDLGIRISVDSFSQAEVEPRLMLVPS